MAFQRPIQGKIVLTCQWCDPDYLYVKYFRGSDVLSQQIAYFTDNHGSVLAPAPLTFTNQMYTRITENKIRVKLTDGSFLPNNTGGYNYMYVDNAPYGDFQSKTCEDIPYFCFITDWKYINDNVYEFTFKIDLIQTYVMAHGFNERTFIDRGMPVNDYGIKLTDGQETKDLTRNCLNVRDFPLYGEPIDTIMGTPVKTRRVFKKFEGGYPSMSLKYLLVLAKDYDTDTDEVVDSDGQAVGALYSPFKYHVFNTDSQLRGYLHQIATDGFADSVVGVYSWFGVSGNTSTYGSVDCYIDNRLEDETSNLSICNNKCLMYPYRYLEIMETSSGNAKKYPYEEFLYEYSSPSNIIGYSQEQIPFKLYESVAPQPAFSVIPLGFNIGDDFGHYQFNNGISFNFPAMQYLISSYLNWCALTEQGLSLQAWNLQVNNALLEFDAGMQQRAIGLGVMQSGLGSIGSGLSAGKAGGSAIAGVIGSAAGSLVNAGFSAELSNLIGERAQRMQDINAERFARESMVQDFQAQRRAPITSSGSGSYIYTLNDGPQPRAYDVSQKKGIIEAIDNYFSAYGYSIQKYGTIKEWAENRPLFTFVKTKNYTPSSVFASIDVKNQIGNIMDRGVTFIISESTPGSGELTPGNYMQPTTRRYNSAPNAYSHLSI